MTKLCECGCGQLTPISNQTHTKYGWVKGEPKRFVTGHHLRPKKTLKDAFMKHFVSGEPGQCWEWQGPMSVMGYGRVSLNGERILAHRASFLIFNGELGEGMEACHKCDNRRCVNPEHLFAGTQADNVADAAIKGRMGTKLTPVLVREIREFLAQGYQQNTIAMMYGISNSTVNNIALRRIWARVE